MVHTGSLDYRLPDDLLRAGVRADHVFQKPVPTLGVIAECVESLLVEEGGEEL